MSEIVNYTKVWGWNCDEERIFFGFESVIVQFSLDDSDTVIYKIRVYAKYNLYAIFIYYMIIC